MTYGRASNPPDVESLDDWEVGVLEEPERLVRLLSAKHVRNI